MKKVKSLKEKSQMIAFRLNDEMADLVAGASEATGLTPNEVGRLATILMVKNRFHEYPEKLEKVKESNSKLTDAVIRLTKDFNDAVYREGE